LRDLYSSTISKGNYNWPCIDLLVLSGILKKQYDVHLIDANTLELSFDKSINKVVKLNPKGVVFSFGNSVKNEDYAFVKKLRKLLPNSKICGTGGLLYHNAIYELENNPDFDACLLNFTTDDILKYFNDEFDDLFNIVYRNNGSIIKKPKRYLQNSFSFPIPLHEQLPLNKYRMSHGRANPLTSVLTAFGCPYKCSFCVSGRIDWATRNIDNILKELDYIKEIGVREIFFRDNVFGAKKGETIQLLNRMIEKKYYFSWVADTRIELINKEFGRLLKKSGCHALHMGVEVSSDEIRNKYNKKMHIQKIKNAFKVCKDNDIKTVGYFILGLPGETIEDIKRTIELSIELDCDYASFNNAIPIIGTDLRDVVIKKGLLMKTNTDEDIYDGSLTSVIETKQLSRTKLLELRNYALRRFYLRPYYIYKIAIGTKTIFQFKMLYIEFSRLLKTILFKK